LNPPQGKKDRSTIAIFAVFVTLILVVGTFLSYLTYESYVSEPPGKKWQDLHILEEMFSGNQYSVDRTIYFPKSLSTKTLPNTLFIVLQPREERERYTNEEQRLLEAYIERGAKLLYASPDGNALDGTVLDNIRIDGHPVFEAGCYDNLSTTWESFNLENKTFNVVTGHQSAIIKSSVDTSYHELGRSSNSSYMDMDGDGIITVKDEPGPFVLGYMKNDQSKTILSNDAMFIDSYLNHADNQQFIFKLIDSILPSGGKVIIEESIHNSKKSPYPKLSSRPGDCFLGIKDTDHDQISDVKEVKVYGTDMNLTDTDSDGMPDGWEIEYGLDPKDPTDAYEDPDNDGYDFNHNGKVDFYPDSVVLSGLNVPKNKNYSDVSLNNLISSPHQYNLAGHNLVRLEHVLVVDNTSYRMGLGALVQFKMDKFTEIVCTMTIQVTDNSTLASLEICIEPGGNKPSELSDKDTYIDIQGMFEITINFMPRLVIRGGERFTNLMEYQFRRDFTGSGTMNETSPTNPDTDNDGMNDGWEAAYGKGFINQSMERPTWQWIYHIDPTWAGDRDLDLDGDGLIYGAKFSGTNLDEFQWGSDPTKADSDQDSYDVNHDGYGLDDRNCIDTAEVLIYHSNPNSWDSDNDSMSDGWEVWFGLDPTDPKDRTGDPDKDLLANIDEWFLGANPRVADTDGDGMPDGWEFKYGLNPLDPQDAMMDSDFNSTGMASPDGLINLFEYYNNTDPTNPDTDGDGLTDLQEILGIYIMLPSRAFKTLVKTNPLKADSDNDSLSDRYEIMTDFDHFPNETGIIVVYPIRDSTTNVIISFEVKYENGGIVNSTNPLYNDTDGDEMPDAWEVTYGLNPWNPADAGADLDGDTFTNLQEFIAKTDPKDPSSHP